MKIKAILIVFTTYVFTGCYANDFAPPGTEYKVAVSTYGNSWVKNKHDFLTTDMIDKEGIINWKDHDKLIRTYFFIKNPAELSLGISAKVLNGLSKIKVIFQGKSKVLNIENNNFESLFVGDFKVKKSGYYFVDLVGIEKSGATYAEVQSVLLGNINEDEVSYIRDEEYWGRRGPSVHLNYQLPDDINQVEWFYSELLVPSGQDVIGSYFMANGFRQGYFGIQVNSASERRILFSVWSPYQTDDPNEIPDDQKIKLIKKGEDVITGEFGNEGSGGQSYKVYPWKTDVAYGFLLRGVPVGNNYTNYSAFFFDPTTDQWHLMAQFSRPKTNSYLTHLHSFLENFIPAQGVFDRMGLYLNQWVYDAQGWHEINKAKFTADNTARRGNRLDYSGGIGPKGFFLKNCGFTDDHTQIDTYFEKEKGEKLPNIDLNLFK